MTSRRRREHIPADLELERAVIASVMMDPSKIEPVKRLLDASDFSLPSHSTIYRGIVEIHSEGNVPDTLTLTARLKERDEFMRVGGASYLAEIMGSVASAYLAEQYARSVADLAQRRRVMEAAERVRIDAQSYKSIDELLEGALKAAQAARPRDGGGGAVLAGDDLIARHEAHTAHWEGIRDLTGVATGITKLDEMTMGYQPGEMIVIAARPSVGKTAFALSSLLSVARAGDRVAIASIEMTRDAIIERLGANICGIDSMVLRRGGLSGDFMTRAINGYGELSGLKFYIDDRGTQRVVDIRGSIEHLCESAPISIAAVDYVQIVKPQTHRPNRNEEVTIISRELKGLAKDLGIPLLVLSQLSRPPKGSEDRRPYLSDLRDSGSLEQDADTVLMLHDIGRQIGTPSEHEHVELIIAKQRNGPIGTIDLRYQRETGRFTEWA